MKVFIDSLKTPAQPNTISKPLTALVREAYQEAINEKGSPQSGNLRLLLADLNECFPKEWSDLVGHLIADKQEMEQAIQAALPDNLEFIQCDFLELNKTSEFPAATLPNASVKVRVKTLSPELKTEIQTLMKQQRTAPATQWEAVELERKFYKSYIDVPVEDVVITDSNGKTQIHQHAIRSPEFESDLPPAEIIRIAKGASNLRTFDRWFLALERTGENKYILTYADGATRKRAVALMPLWDRLRYHLTNWNPFDREQRSS